MDHYLHEIARLHNCRSLFKLMQLCIKKNWLPVVNKGQSVYSADMLPLLSQLQQHFGGDASEVVGNLPSSPASLIHHRSLEPLTAGVSPIDRQRLRHLSLASSKATVALVQDTTPVRRPPSYQGPYIDGHCHDVLVRRKLRMSFPEACAEYVQFGGCDLSQLEAVISNRCHPICWKEENAGCGTKIRLSYGLHPKMVGKMEVKTLGRLLHGTNVVSVGEMGLDFSEDTTDMVAKLCDQSEVFGAQARLALDFDLPLVLHLRGGTRTPFTEVSRTAQAILAAAGCRNHKLVLHCYSGDAKDVSGWLARFQRVHFGVSAATLEDGATVRALPLNRIIPETDSPHLVPTAGLPKGCNFPTMVKVNISKLAEVVGKPIDLVAPLCYQTTKAFYSL